MSEFIQVISQIKPINGLEFALADVNDLRGGYIQVETVEEMMSFKLTNKLKEGMLCYVSKSDDYNMFQYKDNDWQPWIVEGSDGGSIKVVDKISDLEDILFKIKGQIVFVNEINEIRYYDGENWNSFSKIYILSDPPEDRGGIWIDTSDNGYAQKDDIIQTLVSTISILQKRIDQMEYAFKNQMDFGDFTNNKIKQFVNRPGIEPGKGTSPEEDSVIQKDYIENGINPDKEPKEYESVIPNGIHLCIKSGKYSEMIANKNDFLPKELLWCYDTQNLWIKDPKTYNLIKIGSAGTDPEPPITEEMEGIIQELIDGKNKIVGIEMGDMSDTKKTYTILVENGLLSLKNNQLDIRDLNDVDMSKVPPSGYLSNLYEPKDGLGLKVPRIYINSVYCAGEDNQFSYNPVSHNFVELVNMTLKDINLKGLFLHYTHGDSGKWITLPLRGTLKANNGTFLIRGAQCSVIKSNTTYINVSTFDMEWDKTTSKHADILNTSGIIPWDDNELIKFSNNCSFYLSGAPNENYYNDTVLESKVLYKVPERTPEVVPYFINLLGIGKTDGGTNMYAERTGYATNGNNILILRYYNMDPVTQANKILYDSEYNIYRQNSTDYTHLDLNKLGQEGVLDLTVYRPKASFEEKTIFFNKPLLKEGPPNILNCSLGYNAHTTRCFNWVSVGYYNEYLQYRKVGESEWIEIESFKAGDNRDSKNNRNHSIYDRMRILSTDGTPYTVHKCIIDVEEPALKLQYEYRSGRENNWTSIRYFTVRNRQDCIDNGFNFLHTSDQQGFNQEEYETWRLCAELIDSKKEEPGQEYDFSINTGDATQNGNRINEWIGYFNAGRCIHDYKEQMYTVGNNDLCPVNYQVLGDGSDSSKRSPINTQFFFTYEHPFEVPIASSGTYINSVYSFIYGNMYMLSTITEISTGSAADLFGGEGVYEYIKMWSEKDLEKIQNDLLIEFKGVMCHEAPFTIITRKLIKSFVSENSQGDIVENPSQKRGGSRANDVGGYWLSKFMQENGFKFCLCGHKHTYSESRWLHDDLEETMKPYIYDEEYDDSNPDSIIVPDWYNSLPKINLHLCKLTNDPNKGYVKYIMCQATGYKLTSNKELPADNIPWLYNYYESTVSNTGFDVASNDLKFPHYIIFNMNVGNEDENPNNTVNLRKRIKANAYKIKKKGITSAWAYKYNSPINMDELEAVDGNGAKRPNYNIIIPK